MIIVKKITKTDEGYDVNWVLSSEQMQYLLTYAINDLVGRGLIDVDEVKASQDEDREMQLDLLDGLDEEQMEKQ